MGKVDYNGCYESPKMRLLSQLVEFTTASRMILGSVPSKFEYYMH